MTCHPRSFQPAPAEVDRLVYHMRTVASFSDSEWAKGFALSMLRNAKRRTWTPTPKQFDMMSRLVAELFTHANEGGSCDVIESD